jgi:parallel beta-helix repeat protein
MKKSISIVLVLILILMSLTGCFDNKSSNKNGSTNSDIKTVTSTIQALIDAANEGDTIIIPRGTYNENLTIRKTLHLKGEDRDTTIIDPNKEVIAILVINADGTTIKDLTIQNSYWYDTDDGIYLHSDNCEISNCIIKDHDDGINLYWASNNKVLNNQFLENSNGIYVGDISVHGSNIIANNYFANNSGGITLSGVKENEIYENTFADNWRGMFVSCSNNNVIYLNNFLNTPEKFYLIKPENANASKCGPNDEYDCVNTWYKSGYGNYWDDYTGTDNNGDGIGDTQFNIPGDANNIDRYPLMNQINI